MIRAFSREREIPCKGRINPHSLPRARIAFASYIKPRDKSLASEGTAVPESMKAKPFEMNETVRVYHALDASVRLFLDCAKETSDCTHVARRCTGSTER